MTLGAGRYVLHLDDGRGQWFGADLCRFEPHRDADKVRLNYLWAFGFPWFQVGIKEIDGQWMVQRTPRIWLRLRLRWQLWRCRRACA